MSNDSDREIARIFEAQRRADEASAPAFEELVARPRRRRERTARRIVWAAAAAGVACAIALTAIRLLHRPSQPSPFPSTSTGSDVRVSPSELSPAAAALVAWTSPTDSLLQTPGAELLSGLPVLVSPDSRTTPVAPKAERS